jgi:2-oxo-4-hydroxy-4-carboxy-5-ureidoimidazoline decarboxylase
MTLAQLNALDDDGFIAVVGPIFEASSWIAGAVTAWRPFAGVGALHAAMVDAVRNASREQQTALIAAHPDLAGRVAREGRLTPASHSEQAGAGLDRLSDDERARFDRLNAAYRARFGFPFVICVREQTKDSILAAMEQRVMHTREDEIACALCEIEAIARLRLHDLVNDA